MSLNGFSGSQVTLRGQGGRRSELHVPGVMPSESRNAFSQVGSGFTDLASL